MRPKRRWSGGARGSAHEARSGRGVGPQRVPPAHPHPAVIELIAKLVLAYLLGTVMGGLLIARLRGVNLRSAGSGNVGATNALRTQGTWFALGVLLIDIGKGIAAVTLVPALPWPLPQPFALPAEWTAYLCGVAVSLGHIYPVWFGFRGGKGVATLAGVFLALLPGGFAWMILVFALTVMASGYVSLGSLLCGPVAVIYVMLRDEALLSPGVVFALLMALLIVYTHRPNLRRLIDGKENRFEKAMVLRRWRAR